MIKQTSFLQDTCEIISGLFNVVITIVDSGFIRIAGTAHYREQIGKPATNPNVFKTVMEKDRTIIILEPGKEPVCNECRNKDNCQEKAAIYTPLKVNGEIVGGVGIIAFTEEQKRSVTFDNEFFPRFMEKLSELISSKIEAEEYSRILAVNLKETIAIINSVHDGVVAVNEKGLIYQINDSASAFFDVQREFYIDKPIDNLLSPRILERIKKEGGFVDVEDKIGAGKNKVPALITAQSIEEEGRLYGTVLVFKSMKDASSLARKLLHEADYKVSFGDIIGESAEIENVKFLARKVAGSNSTVLIRGESGTGKEMFARAIHNDSSRRDGPFVAVNCAAIPEPLLESELFGYEDGAFTGARRGGKMGKCELAIGGTLFLDEVGDIPLFLQSKFLRMLQERSIERVGGNKTIPVDIRIIAATNRNLEEMIVNREFREDLYYRLNVIPIFLPPLRKRKEDISTVSEYFLSKYATKLEKNIDSLSPDTAALLNSYSWPGNLRELENAIECAVNIENGRTLTVISLPDKIRKGGAEGEIGVKWEERNLPGGARQRDLDSAPNRGPRGPEGNANGPESFQLKESRRKTDVDTIIQALDKYGWDTKGKKNAAKSLGIGIATLYRILNK